MAADSIGEGHANTAATQAAVDQQSNVDLAATNSLGETWRQRNHRRHLRNGDYRRQRWQVMPMRWRLAGRLLWGLLDRAAGGWPGRRRRGCRRGRRGRGGGCGGGCRRDRAGAGWDIAGALVAVDQLDDAVDDQPDQDHNKQGPAAEQYGPAEPRGGLAFFVERIERFGGLELLRRSRRSGRKGWRGWSRCPTWWVASHAIVAVLRRLIVEVVRRAVSCHGTDGTDAT